MEKYIMAKLKPIMMTGSYIEFISVTEAAKLSGYHPEHIRRLIREGKIDAQKFSIVWMVDKESLMEYVKSQKKKDTGT
jgi:excisionase family DNA binding protein